MKGHRPIVLTSREGASVQCSCGWRSRRHRIVRGWVAGGRDVERGAAQADWSAHILEETACPTPS